MTRREKWQITWFVLSCCFATGTIVWAILSAQIANAQVEAQPQPRLKLRGDFDRIEFDNGSVWYIRHGTLNAIWAVPRQEQENLGIKTKMYGMGFEVSLPYEIYEVLDQIYDADIEELKELKQLIRENTSEKAISN